MDTRRRFLQASMAACAAVAIRKPTAMNPPDDLPTNIVDVHQHLWDLSQLKLPWLGDAPEILRHTYHLAEYREATKGLNIKAVYMEVDVDPSMLADEAEHVIGLCRAGTNPTIAAVIGGRPDSPAFGDYAKRFKDSPHVKGVRRVLHGPSTGAGYCLGESFVKGVRLLGDLRLRFDLCMRPTELDDGAKLAELCPDTRFIVDHCGNADAVAFNPKLSDTKPSHEVDPWKRSMEGLAKRSNVICKISGIIARLPKGGDAGDLAPIVSHCLDTFGPDRVVFGSDWPVCLLGRPLRSWVDMLNEIVRSRPAPDQKKLWSENATRLYALGH
jgi:L-fuconolactonase